MIYELKKSNFDNILPLLIEHDLDNHISIKSILMGWSRGKIYVDDPAKPTTALIWAINCMYYFIGNPNNPKFNDHFMSFFNEKLRPENLRLGASVFICTFLQDQGWHESVLEYFKDKDIEKDYRQAFSFKKSHDQHQETKPDFNHVTLKAIQPDLLENKNDSLLSEDIKEFWYSLHDFINIGVGFCVLKDNQVLSSCYACYATDQGLEINIITYNEEDRQKGYAKMAAWAFIDYCLQNKLSFRWEAYENSPSSVLAEKLGFEKAEKYLCYEVNF